MSHLSVHARLTLAFASAMVAVLVATGWFVYARLETDLDESVDLALEARWSAAGRLLQSGVGLETFPLEEADEGLVQLLTVDGEVVSLAGGTVGPALDDDQIMAARAGTMSYEQELPGIEGVARLLAGPFQGNVLVAGQTLANRDEALADFFLSLAIGTPLAVLIASMAGYLLAHAGLAPVEAMRAVASDITHAGDGRRLPVPRAEDQLKRLAVTLNLMIDRLQEAAAREQRFLADAAHELRTPIAIAKAELEALLVAGDGSVAVRSVLEELDRLAQLAEDLLLIARDTDSGLPLVRTRFPIGELIASVRSRFLIRAQAEARAITAAGELATEVEADRHRIAQAVSNLVDNALRHGEGQITLRVTCELPDVIIEVEDEGPGFDPGYVDRAFERFSRGDAARTGPGAGLGLAIVRTVAEAHGGTATIISGGDTTVSLRLPVRSASHLHLILGP
ncbi:MAG TPA: ATP-binding protein [Acidimicrobiia bacterium]|nr:ATP-binding protein [Acidimicrobiia bacterium]